MKDTTDTQRVINPARQRLATRRKRTLRRRSAMAARSVWSECQSRVIESRKFDDRRSLSDRVRGGSTGTTARAMGVWVRPGSESGAETYWGISGTCEGLPLLETNYRNGMHPVDQLPGWCQGLPMHTAANQRELSRYRYPSEKRGCRDGASGRLSQSIVALESRVTRLGGSL